jgi:hypothetical protein
MQMIQPGDQVRWVEYDGADRLVWGTGVVEGTPCACAHIPDHWLAVTRPDGAHDHVDPVEVADVAHPACVRQGAE